MLFYNTFQCEPQVEDISQIPEHHLEVLSFMDYHDLVRPFVAMDIRDGMSREQVSIKYGVTEGFARSVGRLFGFFPRKKSG